MEKKLEIRNSTESDVPDITTLEMAAFGSEKGREIADLVTDLLADFTAMPVLSLVATEGSRVIGHILFTKAKITNSNQPASAVILAPLAVHPDVQSQGIGGLLIKEGLKRLSASGVALVFVLGHPGYYPRYGFHTAGTCGLEAPYPIPDEHADAWMVQELQSGVIGRVSGKVQCADVLNQPQHWRE
jgi:predicted N-acetyltransferase YhbS